MTDLISTLQAEIFKFRPVLAEINEDNSQKELSEYVTKGWSFFSSLPDEGFLELIKDHAVEIYGQQVAGAIYQQLKLKPLVSTTDHHGIWGHPIFLNSCLIYSLYFQPVEVMPVLATESVSLNNTSSWSGSLLWHNENLELKRASFFPDKIKMSPVFCTRPINKTDVSRVEKRLSGQAAELINIIGVKDVLGEKSFSLQACKINYKFWEKVFPNAPKLLYLPLESLVTEYLLRLFNGQPEHPLVRLVFTHGGQKLWQKYFKNEHTFMFWGINAHGHRLSLDSLPVGEQLKALIKSKQIYPYSPLCFVTLLFVGLSCVGGFTQTTWLTRVKEIFLNLLEELNAEPKEKDRIARTPTKNFGESDLAFLCRGEKIFRPSAADVFFHGDANIYDNYKLLASKITLGQSMESALPEIYKVVVPQEKKTARLLEVTNEQLINGNGMAAAIRQAGLGV